MITSLLLVLACGGAAPVVELVDPASGDAGASLKVVGDNFVEGTTATLGGQPVVGLTVRGKTLMEGTAPKGLAPGRHALVVTAPGGKVTTLDGAYEVRAAQREDVPCAGEYTSYGAIATDSGLIKLDRFYPKEDNRREILELPIRDVTAVEYEARLMDDGKLCSAIFIRMKDDRRYMFDDDTDTDLKKRAQDIAVGLGRSIEVVREDERPPEEPTE